MASIIDGKTTYQPGEALPVVGSAAYNFAQSDPTGYQNFKTANPNLQYTQEDQNNFQNNYASKPVTITPSSLAPATPVKVPQSQQSTIGDGIIASTQQSTVNYDKAAENAAKIQAAAGDTASIERSALNSLASSVYGDKSAVQGNQVNLENEAGIKEQQKTLSDLNTEIASQNVAYRAETDKINQTFGTEAQKAVALNNLSDTYGRRLADLAIRQSAAQGNVTAIKENADRQTKLLLAPLDNKLEYLKTFGKDNVDALDEKDKEKLSLIIKDTENQAQGIKELQKAKADMIIEISNNGGGNDQSAIKAVQDASDLSAVASAGSKYTGSLDRQLKQAQITKVYQDIASEKLKQAQEAALLSGKGLRNLSSEENARLNATPQAKALNDGPRFASALIEYRDAINKYGTGEVFGTGAGTLGAAYQAVVGAVKDYYSLGTLDNGVEKLVALGIPKPSVYGQKSARMAGIDTNIQDVVNNLERNANQLESTSFKNSVEAQTLIQTARAIKETQDLAKKSKDEFLASIPTTSGSTAAVDNTSFFNKK